MAGIHLAQIGFASWLMLAWSVAAFIPIAIHLLRRRRQLKISWAAMQLLQKVIDQQSRRSRLQQLILLMLRISALVLFALALARPYWIDPSQAAGQLAQRPSKVWIMVVDTSYSMGYRVDGSSRMERAKQLLSQLVNESQSGDAFALVVIDDPSSPVIGIPSFDAQGTLSEIQRLSETACGSDLNAALAIANDIAADCKADSSLPQDIEVVIVSDLGTDAWQSVVAPLTSGSRATDSQNFSAASLTRLGSLAKVRIEPIVDVDPINVAIEAVVPSSFRPVSGNTLSVDITIASYGSSAKQLPVQLEIDGQVVASETIDVEAGARRQLRLQTSIQSVGPTVLSATVPTDYLPVDNRFDVVVEASQGKRLLIVQPSGTKSNSWQLALRGSTNNAAVDSPIRTVSELSWNSVSLKEWDIVLFNDVVLSDSQFNRLRNFVETGGSVLFAWGPNQSLSQLRNSTAIMRPLLGFEFSSISDEGDWTIDPLEYNSPIVAPFAGFPNAGLLTTPIFRYWKIDNVASDLQIDLSLSSGDPWIVRNKIGMGQVASVLSAPEEGQNSAARQSWNAVTTWPSFLPLAQQLAQSMSDLESSSYNRLAGQPLADRLTTSVRTSSIRLLRPDQTEITIACAQSESSTTASWSYTNTNMRGVYRAIESSQTQRPFAVNLDPIQSSLQSVNANAIRQLVPNQSLETSESNDYQPVSASDGFARGLLIALIGVLIAESVLAWSLGKQTQ